MDVKNLFSGIAIIIDDEIDNEESDIAKIKNNIVKNNIPVATYSDIPGCEVIDALSHASFIILDWDYNNDLSNSEDPTERLIIPSELKEEKQKNVINFINKILENIFVPIFIFTALNPDEVIETLKEHNVIFCDKPNRVFVKQKITISSEQELFDSISKWLKEMPSVYVLKEWEKVIHKTKDMMFLELYRYSPNWVAAIWEMLKKDSIENSYEFGVFITKNLINRIGSYNFDEQYLHCPSTATQEELYKIIEGERYLCYEEQPEQAYTGDLFKINGKYYLNIRAQCDLSRRNQQGNYNPKLYCIKGEKLRTADIVTDIRLTTEGELVFSAGKHFSLEKLSEICKNEEELIKFNSNFTKHRNKIFFGKGELLEKRPEAIIACIDNCKVIKFNLDIYIKDFLDIKDRRIGRILPPYINRIQQKCSQYIVREGVMPIPEELFNDIV